MRFALPLILLACAAQVSAALRNSELKEEAIERMNALMKRRAENTPQQGRPIVTKNKDGTLVGFTDIIKVFEADAIFKGKWSANKSAGAGDLFNGFINQNGESISYFQVDNLDTRATTVYTFFKDEVSLPLTYRNMSILKAHS